MNKRLFAIVFASLVATCVYAMQQEGFEKFKTQAMIEQLKQETTEFRQSYEAADVPVEAYVGSAATPVKKVLYTPRFANSVKKQLFKNHEEEVASIEAHNGQRSKKFKKPRYAR